MKKEKLGRFKSFTHTHAPIRKEPKLWGHRGCRGPDNPPENSIAAFIQAMEQGADGIELDARCTRDGHVVVFHDHTLEEKTNGSGRLEDKTLAQLRALRLKKNGSDELSEETIPTLEETLDAVYVHKALYDRDHKKPFVVNIELKGKDIAPLVAQEIHHQLERDWSRDNFLVSSFDMESLMEMKRADPLIRRGMLLAGSTENYRVSEEEVESKLNSYAKELAPATVNVTWDSMTLDTVSMIEEAGAEPVAWTYKEVLPAKMKGKEKEMMGILAAAGIPIITDYPHQMREVIQKITPHLMHKKPIRLE